MNSKIKNIVVYLFLFASILGFSTITLNASTKVLLYEHNFNIKDNNLFINHSYIKSDEVVLSQVSAIKGIKNEYSNWWYHLNSKKTQNLISNFNGQKVLGKFVNSPSFYFNLASHGALDFTKNDYIIEYDVYMNNVESGDKITSYYKIKNNSYQELSVINNKEGHTKVSKTIRPTVDTNDIYIFFAIKTNNNNDKIYIDNLRIYKVEDIDTEKPVISPSSKTFTAFKNNPLTFPIVKANDNVDGSVVLTPTGSVDFTKTGTYTLTYNHTDKAGNVADTVIHTYNVVIDTEKPVILPSNQTFTKTLGFSYIPLKVEAIDNADGRITLTPTGTIKNNVEGTYELVYNYTDKAGNIANTVTHTFIVKKPPSLYAGIKEHNNLGFDETIKTFFPTNISCLKTTTDVQNKINEIVSGTIHDSYINLCSNGYYEMDLIISSPKWLNGLTIRTVKDISSVAKARIVGKVHLELLRVLKLENVSIKSDAKDNYALTLNNIDNSYIEGIEIVSENNGIIGNKIDSGITIKNSEIYVNTNGIKITGGSGSTLNSEFTHNGITYNGNNKSSIENVLIQKNTFANNFSNSNNIHISDSGDRAISGKGMETTIDNLDISKLEVYATLNGVSLFNSGKATIESSRLFSIVDNGLNIAFYDNNNGTDLSIFENYIYSQQNQALYLNDIKGAIINQNFVVSESDNSIYINGNSSTSSSQLEIYQNCFQHGSMKRHLQTNENVSDIRLEKSSKGNFYDLGLDENKDQLYCSGSSGLTSKCTNDQTIYQTKTTNFVDTSAYVKCINPLLDKSLIPNELTEILDVNPTSDILFTDSKTNEETGITAFAKNKQAGNTDNSQRINVLIIGDDSGSMSTVAGKYKNFIDVNNNQIYSIKKSSGKYYYYNEAGTYIGSSYSVPSFFKSLTEIQNEVIHKVIDRYKGISDLRFSTIKLSSGLSTSSRIQDWTTNESATFTNFKTVYRDGYPSKGTYYGNAIKDTINQLNAIKNDNDLNKADKTIVYYISDGQASDSAWESASELKKLENAIVGNSSVYKFYTIALGQGDGISGDLKKVSITTEDMKTPPTLIVKDPSELESVLLSTVDSIVNYNLYEDFIHSGNLQNELFNIDTITGNITLKEALTPVEEAIAQANAGLTGTNFEGAYFQVGIIAFDTLQTSVKTKAKAFKVYLSSVIDTEQEPLQCDTYKNALQTRGDCSTGVKDITLNSNSASIFGGITSEVYACGYTIADSFELGYGNGNSTVNLNENTEDIKSTNTNYFKPANIYIPEYINTSTTNASLQGSNTNLSANKNFNNVELNSTNKMYSINNTLSTININTIKSVGNTILTLKNGIYQINSIGNFAGANNLKILTEGVEELKINSLSLPKGSVVNLKTNRKVYIETLELVEGVTLTIDTDQLKIKKLKTTGSNVTLDNIILKANKIEIEEIEMVDSTYDIKFENKDTATRQLVKNNSLIINKNVSMEFDDGEYYFTGYTSSFESRSSNEDIFKAQKFETSKISNLYFNQDIEFVNNSVNINFEVEENKGKIYGDNSVNLQINVNGNITFTGNKVNIKALLYSEGTIEFGANLNLIGAMSALGFVFGNGSHDITFSEHLKSADYGGLCTNDSFKEFAFDRITFFDTDQTATSRIMNTKIVGETFNFNVGVFDADNKGNISTDLTKNSGIEFDYAFYELPEDNVFDVTKAISGTYEYRENKTNSDGYITESATLGLSESKAFAYKKVILGIKACTINDENGTPQILPMANCTATAGASINVYYAITDTTTGKYRKDLFALRPESIVSEIKALENSGATEVGIDISGSNLNNSNNKLLKAGEELKITITPYSANKLLISNYNEAVKIEVEKGHNDMVIDGIVSYQVGGVITKSNDVAENELTFTLTNGINDITNIAYNEVGIPNIIIKENTDFASVDANDFDNIIQSKLDEQTIPKFEKKIGRFIPAKFNVTAIDLSSITGNNTISNTCTYNYLNKDNLDISTFEYEIDVEAQNTANERTRNYHSTFANATTFTYDYAWDINIGTDNQNRLGLSNSTVSSTKTFNDTSINKFDNDDWSEGQITKDNKFELDIDILQDVLVDRNTPFEPFKVNLGQTNNYELTNINVTDGEVLGADTVNSNNRTYTGIGAGSQPTEITYVYGRINPIDTSSVEGGDAEVNVYYEIYGSTSGSRTILGSSDLAINPTGGGLRESVNDSNWYQNYKHSACDNGVTYSINYTGVTGSNITEATDTSNPQRDIITLTLNSTVKRPVSVIGDIDLSTAPTAGQTYLYLYHNSTYNNNDRDRFKVEFLPAQVENSVNETIESDSSNSTLIRKNSSRFIR